jgi:hypothetical protein
MYLDLRMARSISRMLQFYQDWLFLLLVLQLIFQFCIKAPSCGILHLVCRHFFQSLYILNCFCQIHIYFFFRTINEPCCVMDCPVSQTL